MWKYLIGNKPRPSKTKYEFKMLHSFEKRQKEALRIREKYPDRVPIVLEKSDSSDVVDIDKHKYLVPEDMTIGQFMYSIRKNMKIDSSQSIFFFINNVTIPRMEDNFGIIYEKNKDKDNYLYITFSSEIAFG
jgi:GABA(A) receptor-associated protein